MARIKQNDDKQKEKTYQFEFEKNVTIPVTLRFLDTGQITVDQASQKWGDKISKQLLLWRNIPKASGVNQFDASVKQICTHYGINPRKPKGKTEKDKVGSVMNFVLRRIDDEERIVRVSTQTLCHFRHAFEIVDGQVAFIPRIAALFTEDELDATNRDHFELTADPADTIFPTIDESIGAEHMIALATLFVKNFDVDLQLDQFYMDMVEEFDDAPQLEAGPTIEIMMPTEDDDYDDAGFQPE